MVVPFNPQQSHIVVLLITAHTYHSPLLFRSVIFYTELTT